MGMVDLLGILMRFMNHWFILLYSKTPTAKAITKIVGQFSILIKIRLSLSHLL
jgi:hypothetical protein